MHEKIGLEGCFSLLISDYFQLIEKKTSEMSIIADKSIEFREFDIDEGLLKGEIVFIDG